jgi:DNA-binding MarR family transcriptional regulator
MTVNSENPVFIIHRTHDMLKICEDKIFGEHGLTTEQYAVLIAIKHLDEPVRVTDVARRLIRSTNSVSMIVDRMVKAGLLRRLRDRNDRRTVHLIITSKAETLVKPATMASQDFIQKILSQVSHEDEQTLIRLFETLQHEVEVYSK